MDSYNDVVGEGIVDALSSHTKAITLVANGRGRIRKTSFFLSPHRVAAHSGQHGQGYLRSAINCGAGFRATWSVIFLYSRNKCFDLLLLLCDGRLQPLDLAVLFQELV